MRWTKQVHHGKAERNTLRILFGSWQEACISDRGDVNRHRSAVECISHFPDVFRQSLTQQELMCASRPEAAEALVSNIIVTTV